MPSNKHMHLHRRQGGGNPLEQLGNAINQAGQEIGNIVNGGKDNNDGGNGGGHHHHDDSSSQGLDYSKHLDVRDSNTGSGIATLFSVVLYTESQTFSGPAVMSTVKPAPSPSKTPSPIEPVPVKSTSAQPATSAAAASTTTPSRQISTTASPTPSSAASDTSLLNSISVTPIPSASASVIAGTSTNPTAAGSDLSSTGAGNVSGAAASTTPSSAASTTTGQQNTGFSTGAKVGIAFGVIIGVLGLAALAFAIWRAKKNRDEEAYNEKSPFSDKAAAPAPAALGTQAPLPAPAMSSTTSLGATAYGPGREQDRSSIGTPVNPFGAGAVPLSGNAPGAPSHADANSLSSFDAERAAFAAGTGAVTAATLARRTSVPTPLKVNNRSQSPALAPPPVLASPVGSQFSEISATPADAAGPPKMHRVQMDFTPTMEDELQIKAGEIVRIIREFDDGWCSVELLVRDKSGTVLRHQQGVCPRTCLSRLPLKPRQKRPGPPIAQPHTDSPRPASKDNNVPRSTSPALNSKPAQRSMSPGPYGGGPMPKTDDTRGRSRSNSAGDVQARRAAGHGPSPMNPASRAAKDLELPIQLQSPLEKPPTLGHSKSNSVASMPSSPVTRKPVPKKTM